MIPDQITNAARNANCRQGDGTWKCWEGSGRTPAGMMHPECAVAGAFRALPNCQEVLWAVSDARAALGVLARMASDQ